MRRSPRVSGAAKVNNNRLWVEEHLAFNECGGRSHALADGADAAESSGGVGEVVGCGEEAESKRNHQIIDEEIAMLPSAAGAMS